MVVDVFRERIFTIVHASLDTMVLTASQRISHVRVILVEIAVFARICLMERIDARVRPVSMAAIAS